MTFGQNRVILSLCEMPGREVKISRMERSPDYDIYSEAA